MKHTLHNKVYLRQERQRILTMKNFNIFFKDYLFLKIAFFVFTVILLFEQFLEYLIEKPTYTSISKAKLGN